MLENLNKILWAVAISFIFLNSIYFSFKLKFPQLKIRTIIKNVFSKNTSSGIKPMDALMISLGSKIGAGSLAGIAFAIYYGGIGTIFWMWVSSFFVSVNCFLENILSTLYKEKDQEFYKGGPSYYIKNGLNKKKLAYLYSFLAVLAYILGFLAIQNNTITTLVTEIYPVNKILIALLVTLLAGIVILKGLNIISKICNKIVPIMMISYFIVGLIVIFSNLNSVPAVFLNIIKDAFTPSAVTGGIIYTFVIGIQKATFINEAGVGTSAISSGATSNKDPIKQGYFGIFETYFINLFLITITAFIIVLSNYESLNLTGINGIEITKYAFFFHLGHFGEIILLLILTLFSFSTIITVYYYGESNLKFITNKSKHLKFLKAFSIVILFLGGIVSASFVWELADIFIALLAIINIYAIFKLKGRVLAITRDKSYNKNGW
mgnify:FL=1